LLSTMTENVLLYLCCPRVGEAEPLTSLEEGVTSFAWSPDGTRIAYTATEPKSAAIKDREKKYGEFQVIDQEHRMTHLFLLDLRSKATRALTSGAFTVGSFEWSPDGSAIAFDHRADPTPASSGTADISIVSVADGAVRKLVTQEGPDTHPVWAPDRSRIAFQTAMASPAYYYANQVIATVPASGGTPTPLTSSFDEDPSIVAWKPSGIFFSASQRTWSYLHRLDPSTKTISRVSPDGDVIDSSFSMSKDGSA